MAKATVSAAQITEKFKDVAEKAEVVQIPDGKPGYAFPGSLNIRAEIKILIITVRFRIGLDDKTISETIKVINDLQKIEGMPPIVICPQGVNLSPIFEPAEMGSWRKEIMDLRVKLDEETLRANNAEAKLKNFHVAAQRSVKELAAEASG